MKIGLVRRGYSPTGGAEAYLRRFAAAAVALGHEARLYSEEWPQEAWPWEWVPIQSRSPQGFADSLRARHGQGGCDFLFSLERVWACDAYRAGDGVHAAWLERRAAFEAPWKPWLRSWNRKHRQTLTLEQALFGARNSRQRQVIVAGEESKQAETTPGAGMVIANSSMVKMEIERLFSYPPERIHVIYNGVPSAAPALAAQRDLVRRELGFGPGEYVLLFAGSGWERKGLRFAIAALERLAAPARLLVIGRGSMRGLPASRRVIFVGPQPDLSRYFAAADAFVLPTLYEPFSNACLEALAADLPVITTRYNGFAEIIQSGVEGEVVEDPRDVNGLAAAIESWRDPERRRAIRPALRAVAARFTVEENCRQTLALIQERHRFLTSGA